MRPTKFSGPLLYSGNPSTVAASLEDIPISFNPDYCTFFDEFQGVPGTVPPGYNFDALASGTFEYSEGNSLASGADTLYGWSSLSSDAANPDQNNSGGTFMAQESLQANATKQLFVEGRVSLASPATCEFFFGISHDDDYTSGFDSNRLVGFELVGGTNSLGLVAKEGGGITTTVEDVFTFPNGSTVAGQHLSGGVNLSPVLGIRIGSAGTTASGLVADFYVNRRHVGTILNTDSVNYIGSSLKGVCTSFKKTSEIAGLTIGTQLEASVASSSNVLINGTSYDNIPGIGKGQQMYVDQTLEIGAEDVRVSTIGLSDGNLTVKLERAVNGTSAILHTVDTAIDATTQACLVDYVSAIYSRYPRGAGYANYLVDPGR